MDNKILTLGQIQQMSTDETVEAYRNGYTLSENSETYLPQVYSSNNIPQVYSATNTGSHYTLSDVGVITVAIGISVGLLGLLTWYIIKKEEERILSEIKQTVLSATQKVSFIEKLVPIAERIGERLFPKKIS